MRCNATISIAPRGKVNKVRCDAGCDGIVVDPLVGSGGLLG